MGRTKNDGHANSEFGLDVRGSGEGTG